jgi:hypothetical protein
MSNSFDKASVLLKELSRIEVSDDTVERVCQEEGQSAAKRVASSTQARRLFPWHRGRWNSTATG